MILPISGGLKYPDLGLIGQGLWVFWEVLGFGVQYQALVCSFGDSGGFAGVAPQAMRSIIDQSTTGWLSGSEGFGDWGPVIPLHYFTVLGT